MSKPVTWDQIIDAAAEQRRQGRRPGQQVRGLRRLDQRPDRGRRRRDRQRHRRGRRRQARHRLRGRARRPPRSSRSWPTPRPRRADLSVSNEGTAAATFGSRPGRVPGQLDLHLDQLRRGASPRSRRTSATPATRETVEGEQSAPPYGGIGIGVSAYSDHMDEAMEAVECLTSPENQGVNAELTGNMPASPAGYEYPPLKKIYPPGPAGAVPGEPRRRRAAHRHAVLERHLRRAPEHVAPAVGRQLGDARRSPQTFIDDVLHGRSLL